MKYLPLFLACLLTACGTLPEPFYGDPGVEGAKLATPPAPVLIVPPPDNAMLADDSAKLYATDLANALAALDVPSVARPAQKTDWRVTTTAQLNGTNVVPHYAITGPDGKAYGGQDGAPVPAQDWANGNPAALNTAATADALTLTKLLARVNADVQQSNPRSLENRPPVIFFSGVTGAPGDGNHALALNMNRDLPGLGVQQTSKPAQADYTVNGVVKTQPDTGGQILVEIDWLVHDSNNRIVGQVTQLHDLDPADITPYWGDIAAAAAAEGASGIHTVIENDTLKKKPS
jgi:hypothetical protein